MNACMKFYSEEIKKVFQELDSNEDGLTVLEAKKRLEINGKNKLIAEKKESKINKFLDEFKDLMIVVLIISAIVSFILSLINKESFIDSIIIIAIVIVNAILGFIQELKADKAIDSLKKMQILKVKVKRENKVDIINSEDLVKGDIILLEAGDTVPADARIFFEVSLKVDESCLTGESEAVNKSTAPVDKNTPLSLRSNMVYSGTNIVYGKCHAVVCEVAMDTEFGRIAESLNKDGKEITPLQKKINDISKFLSIVIAIIILIMFVIGFIKGMGILDIIMLSISLAVAAIPEGLPAVITITLSLGMSAMAKKNAIVRKMSSVETLGCTEIICSDKTGTITQNKMRVQEVFYENKIWDIKEMDKNNLLFQAMCLNNDAIKNDIEYIGDPTEIALYECLENRIDLIELRNKNIRINELPFDSDRKMMSTVHLNDGNIYVYTKGSFDSLINHCTHVLENNKPVKMTKEKKQKLKEIETEESNKAYRILAFAYKKMPKKEKSIIEEDLIFLGMTAMIDPPREDVKEAIRLCKEAHIKPVMITGDSLSTATAIAREIGILERENQAITGSDLDKMTEEELIKNVANYSVFARVSPLNKVSIVNAWKKNQKIVAMTGDGVNDAPALKNADIGVGMGITGTEVSKSVSDIILADDSFSTIVVAVKEGRRIYDNIRKVLVYLITGNIAEVLVVFLGMLFGMQIFMPIQLLYINLITDSIPAIALAFEKEEKNIMHKNVRKKDDSFFTPFLIAKIVSSAILKTIAILLIYFTNLKLYGAEIAISMSFLTLILLEMIFVFSCKNLKTNVMHKNILNNKFMNLSMLLLIGIQLIIFLTPLKEVFNIVKLNGMQVLYCLFIVFVVFIVDELSKKIMTTICKD